MNELNGRNNCDPKGSSAHSNLFLGIGIWWTVIHFLENVGIPEGLNYVG
jgi:hypothetical protein